MVSIKTPLYKYFPLSIFTQIWKGKGVAIKPDSDDEESLEEVLDEDSKVGSNTCLALQLSYNTEAVTID